MECYGCGRTVQGYQYRNMHRDVWSEQLRCEHCDYALTDNMRSATDRDIYLVTRRCRTCGKMFQTSALKQAPCPICRSHPAGGPRR